jgi:hypothetical protein
MSPSNGSTVSGTISFEADAFDADGIQYVHFWVDNTSLGSDDSAPYGVSWDTTNVTNGTHLAKILAFDNAGLSTMKYVSVTVINPDSQPPTIAITSPANGATVSGSVMLTANAFDSQGVKEVHFFVDGVPIARDTIAPYSRSVNTSTIPAGTHGWQAMAIDWGNNSAVASVTVNVAGQSAGSVAETGGIAGEARLRWGLLGRDSVVWRLVLPWR